jgi:succinyl-CoA synthetase alpha subunit
VSMSVRVASTVRNLILGSNSRVIYQGFTGKEVNRPTANTKEQASLNAKDSIAYGTKVVGGVSPGKAGRHPTLGMPVYDTVKEVVLSSM